MSAKWQHAYFHILGLNFLVFSLSPPLPRAYYALFVYGINVETQSNSVFIYSLPFSCVGHVTGLVGGHGPVVKHLGLRARWRRLAPDGPLRLCSSRQASVPPSARGG